MGKTINRPVGKIFATVRLRSASLWGLVSGSWDTETKLKKLSVENRSLQGNLVVLSDRVSVLERELEQASSVRDMLKNSSFLAVPATVTSRNYNLFFDELTLDVGTEQGIEPGMGVTQGHYVLGKVTSVGRWSSTVVLLTSAQCKISAKVLRNQKQGLLMGGEAGEGGLMCRMKYVFDDEKTPKPAVKQKDQIVTSGTDPAFVPGMPIGSVAKTLSPKGGLFYDIQILPLADLSTVYSVLVLKNTRRAE